MMSWPSTVTVPALGLTMPQTMLISVVLPAPFGPSRAKISPRRISKLMRCSAWNPDAYVFERLEMEMIEGMGAPAAAAGKVEKSDLGRWVARQKRRGDSKPRAPGL